MRRYITGYYLDNATRSMDELSWIFTVEGAVSFGEGAGSPVPSGVLEASVKLKMIWAFAPRGKTMRAALKALPDDLKEGKAVQVARIKTPIESAPGFCNQR